ncbi:MAG TPA: hypothetical protein PLC07_03385 [Bacillota bacterium]|nr:hypothetical protein [Bacillota bacterium]HPT86662.1 hypothetical protein [Bacillota bacterium]
MKRKNLPGQLPLELDWGLMNWVDSTGETMESYEQSAVSLYRNPVRNLLPRSPLLDEIMMHDNQ